MRPADCVAVEGDCACELCAAEYERNGFALELVRARGELGRVRASRNESEERVRERDGVLGELCEAFRRFDRGDRLGLLTLAVIVRRAEERFAPWPTDDLCHPGGSARVSSTPSTSALGVRGNMQGEKKMNKNGMVSGLGEVGAEGGT